MRNLMRYGGLALLGLALAMIPPSFASAASMAVPMSGMQISPGISGTGGAPPTSFFPPSGVSGGEGRRELKVRGRVLKDGETAQPGTEIVHLRFKNSTVAMALESPAPPGDISLSRQDEYARDLYRAIVTKEVQVIGSDAELARLEHPDSSNGRVQVEGYVFNRSNPYLVIEWLGAAR